MPIIDAVRRQSCQPDSTIRSDIFRSVKAATVQRTDKVMTFNSPLDRSAPPSDGIAPLNNQEGILPIVALHACHWACTAANECRRRRPAIMVSSTSSTNRSDCRPPNPPRMLSSRHRQRWLSLFIAAVDGIVTFATEQYVVAADTADESSTVHQPSTVSLSPARNESCRRRRHPRNAVFTEATSMKVVTSHHGRMVNRLPRTNNRRLCRCPLPAMTLSVYSLPAKIESLPSPP